MTRNGAIKKPSFLWQGMLIVLPAILLAGVGLLSLRQDRIIAQHQATEEARKIALELAQRLLPKALRADFQPLGAVEQFRAAPTRAEMDPIMIYARKPEPRIACLVDPEGRLVYPLPMTPAPSPQPLDLGGLNEDQQSDWEAAQQAAFVDEDLDAALAALGRFLAQAPPEGFAALAHYQAGVMNRAKGAADAARREFETVIRQYPQAVSEAGVDLKMLGELHLLDLAATARASTGQKDRWINSLCAQAVLSPSAWSRLLFEKVSVLEAGLPVAAESGGSLADAGRAGNLTNREATNTAPSNSAGPRPGSVTAAWLSVWEAHAQARRLLAVYREATLDSPPSAASQFRWVNTGPAHNWLVIPHPGNGMQWLLGLAEADVRQLARRVMSEQSCPPYLGLAVEIAGKPVSVITNDAVVLAVAATVEAGASSIPLARASVHLTSPQSLYAGQRRRSFWFGSMIALSALTVLIGFGAAWHAFRREQQLSEMKTNFVSSVSHELRAPIASVRLMAEELEDLRSLDQQKNAAYHRFIVQECRRLSALIENVLDFSRHEQGRKEYEFESTDLVALVQETARLMQAYGADRQILVQPVIRGEPGPVDLDGRAIQQVLVNLTDNAIKHSPPNSAVRVGVEFQSEHVALWVEDQGEGIPPEDHERIFERFYRRGSELRRETQGVGLGLAIVRYVTEAHGGQVTVRSAVGQGSRFTVRLPRKGEVEPTAAISP